MTLTSRCVAALLLEAIARTLFANTVAAAC
jgi:hypothetical protein